MKRIYVTIRFASAFGAFLAILSFAMPARATDYQGAIVQVDMSSDASVAPGRGLCVAMSPAMPNTWACLPLSAGLYREITALLLSAYLASPQRNCLLGVTWTGGPPFYNQISHAVCL